jgi:uncharacterized protein YukE
MAPRKVAPVDQSTWNSLQARIERLMEEKVRLLDEWSEASKRAYCAPTPYRHDAFQKVGDKYSDLVDTLDAHINTLKANNGDFTPRIERLLMRTGRQSIC